MTNQSFSTTDVVYNSPNILDIGISDFTSPTTLISASPTQQIKLLYVSVYAVNNAQLDFRVGTDYLFVPALVGSKSWDVNLYGNPVLLVLGGDLDVYGDPTDSNVFISVHYTIVG